MSMCPSRYLSSMVWQRELRSMNHGNVVWSLLPWLSNYWDNCLSFRARRTSRSRNSHPIVFTNIFGTLSLFELPLYKYRMVSHSLIFPKSISLEVDYMTHGESYSLTTFSRVSVSRVFISTCWLWSEFFFQIIYLDRIYAWHAEKFMHDCFGFLSFK